MRIDVVETREFGLRAADAFLELVGDDGGAVVGLATGNTTTPMYTALGERGVPRVRAFAIDEYLGRPNHPCGNAVYFERHWRSIPGAGPVEQFDISTRDLGRECERFAAALEEAGGLDVVVLGIGMNGHLAFNEPGSTPEDGVRVVNLTKTTRAAARGCWGDEVPLRGVTLGLREILGARRVLLLATGGSKAEVIERALRGPVGPECPASYLQGHGAVTVVLNRDAGSRLAP